MTNPTGIAFESGSDQFYLTVVDPDPPALGEIVRINTDGSGLTTILSGLAGALAIAIAPPDDYVPALSAWGTVILALFVLAASVFVIRTRSHRPSRQGLTSRTDGK